MYTNGISNAPTPSEFPIQIGATWIDSDRCVCIIDELYIYNHTLSTEEIRDLMHYNIKDDYLIAITDNKDQLYVSNKQPSDYIITDKICIEYNTINKGDNVILIPVCSIINVQTHLEYTLELIDMINRLFLIY